MQATTFIYTLQDPITNEIKYVGKTNNLKNRLSSHMNTHNRINPTRKAWILDLKSRKLKPIISVLDTVPLKDWQFWESYWIWQLRSWGIALLNGDNGGLGSDRMKDESKKKTASKLLGKFYGDVKPILCYSKKGVFIKEYQSCRHAAEWLGNKKYSSVIRHCVLGKSLSSYGYIWRYKTENYPKVIKTGFLPNGRTQKSVDANIKKKGKRNYKNCKKVYQFNSKGKLIAEYPSLMDAYDQTGILSSCICSVCNGGKKRTGGFCWSYSKEIVIREQKRQKQAVVKYTIDGLFLEIYSSIKEASDANKGASRCQIKRCIDGKGKVSGGFVWKHG